MFDRKYMEKAIALAKKGVGRVNPNPLVGAVIVKDDRIIGEGYHHEYGSLHAERDALESLTESAEGADMYVTLEPCCHTGKQPPCVDAIIEHKIKRVYVGSDDPNPLVSGKGIFRLRQAGVEVIPHTMKQECDAINTVFFHYISTGLPYVVMKYAMTLDGKIATSEGHSRWISNESSRRITHEYRNELSAIMCGLGTVRKDDPLLTCRINGGRNPVRIICDTDLRIPMESNIVKTADKVRTYIAASSRIEKVKQGKIRELTEKKVGVLLIPDNGNMVDIDYLMRFLGEKLQIDSILLEGGGTLNYSMLKAGYVNEARVFISPKIFGGADARTPVEGIGIAETKDAFRFEQVSLENIDDDIYIRLINRAGVKG